MAKFLTTSGNSFYIEQIIINAERHLTLVSPFLSLSKNLIDRLSDADHENVKITLIYGKSDLKKSEKTKIEAFKNIEIFYCENLHAKAYHNEETMIVTSMNLYEFSQQNNREMGVLIERTIDEQIYKDVIKEIESIKNSSILEKKLETKNITELIYLSEDKDERWNFFYPSLLRVLQVKLDNYKVIQERENCITIEDCLNGEVEIVINGRVDFNFKDYKFFRHIKNNARNELREILPGIRFYWNRNCINIYFERNYKAEINENGLVEIVNKYLNIILKTKEVIKKYQ
jgi:hypothetical protein